METGERAVIRKAGLVGFWTSASRVLGLTRDVLMAGYFGTSLWMSSFVVAFTVPNLFRRFFGEGALSAALVPVLVETRHKHGERAAWSLAFRVFALAAIILCAVVVLGWILCAVLLHIGMESPRTTIVLQLLQIMLPYAVFICLAALFMAALNSYGVFGIPAAMPCVLNVTWIAALVLLVPRAAGPAEGIRLVAWAVVAAGILQAALQVPSMWRRGFRVQGGLALDEPVFRVVRLTVPAALGMAITQVNVVVDRLLATLIAAWAPAALYYSERLIYLPLGIIATALSTVLLPAYSHQVARAEERDVRETLLLSMRTMLFLMIPAATGLCVVARPIIEMIYQWRAFTPESTWLTARALRFYAPGLVVFGLNKALVPAFYARQDTRTPVRLGMRAVGLNIAFNIFFVLTLPLYFKHAGIALGTVLSESAFMIMLSHRLTREVGGIDWAVLRRSAFRIMTAAAGMALLIFLMQDSLHAFIVRLGITGKSAQLAYALGLVVGGVTAYLVLAFLLRVPELASLRQAWRSPRAGR